MKIFQTDQTSLHCNFFIKKVPQSFISLKPIKKAFGPLVLLSILDPRALGLFFLGGVGKREELWGRE